jgi:predicted MPP superfamily phosphohydrolase
MFFAVAVIIILAILLSGHFAVYQFVIAIFSISSPSAILVLRVLTVLLPVSFVGGLIFSSFYNNLVSRMLYRITAVWMAFFCYLLLLGGLYSFIALFYPSVLFGQIFFIFALLLSLYGLIHAGQTKVVRKEIALPHLSDAWKGKKIIFMSDLHLGQIRSEDFAEKVADLANKESPEMILIGGDLYDGVKIDARKIIEPLRVLKPSRGIFFVWGNHEEFHDNVSYRKALTEHGIKILEDEVALVEGLQIVGVDYKTTETKKDFQNVFEAIKLDVHLPSILLKHTPQYLEIAEAKGISLCLSGHTHKAQVFPFSILTRYIFKGFDYGLKKLGTMQVYTSSGAGTWGPPIRVGSQSEIIVFTLAVSEV